MSVPKDIRIRGIRTPVLGGTIIGRRDPGLGPPTVLTIQEVAQDLLGTGKFPQVIPPSPIYVPADGLVILTSGVPAVVCSFPLAEGAWDISGNITFNPNGAASVSFTDAIVAVNTSPALPTGPNSGGYAESTSSMSITRPTTIATAVMRVMFLSPGRVYLLAQVTFS